MPKYWESTDGRIERLEEELYFARRTMLSVLPERHRDCLNAFGSATTRRDLHAWESGVIEKIVEMAEPGPENYFGVRRAPCPLCKGEGSDPYTVGFKLDEGLKRHLSGWGNTRQCAVTREAFAYASYCLRDKIFESERAETEANERTLVKRRKSERLFITDPSQSPRLSNESLAGYFDDPNDYRDTDGMVFAEQRLRALGFEIETKGRVTTYKFTSDELIVFADPRKKGRITFLVFIEHPKRNKRDYFTTSFYLLDSWKNELPRKFMDHLEHARDVIARRL
jgi:hypothetical protein